MAITGTAAALVAMSAGSAAASPVRSHAPTIPGIAAPPVIASGYYAVPIAGGSPGFIHIQDSFTVPQVACTSTQTSVAQQRTGLDGINDGTIERVGISETCPQGAPPTDSAWYQMYPAKGHIKFSPHAGDTVDLSVTEDGGVYTLSIHDLTSGQSFNVTQTCDTCKHSSAQVTAGPKTGTALANFGSVDFTDIVVVDDANAVGGLSNPGVWGTGKLTDPGPGAHTVAGPLHTFPPPSPHSEFVDSYAP